MHCGIHCRFVHILRMLMGNCFDFVKNNVKSQFSFLMKIPDCFNILSIFRKNYNIDHKIDENIYASFLVFAHIFKSKFSTGYCLLFWKVIKTTCNFIMASPV